MQKVLVNKMQKKKTIAFIFARGGSKGLPFKNKLILAGHPLIAYSIYISKINSMIDDVYVSTDSEEISNIAFNYGAKVIERPKKLAEDNSPEYLSWKHAIKDVQSSIGLFDNFISLPPTSPLRSLEDTKKCLLAINNQADSIITITPSSRSPWFNMVEKDPDNYVTILNNSKNISRRQDTPESFDITTVAYVSTPKFILNTSSIWDGRVKAIIIPKERAIDIDDKFDFFVANHFISQRKDLIIQKFY